MYFNILRVGSILRNYSREEPSLIHYKVFTSRGPESRIIVYEWTRNK
jgi:hypothetical protein